MNILTQREDDALGSSPNRKMIKNIDSTSELSLIDEENQKNKPTFSFKPYCLDPEKIIDDEFDQLKPLK
jgi:hypothetical protein